MSIFAETLIKNRKIMRLKSCMLMCSLFMASLASASNFASDSFKTKSGKELIITFIKHGSLMLTYDNHSIQVDPVSEYADYTTFPKADIILITHEHGDHLDPKAIQAVEKSGTEIIANENSQKKLGKGKVLKNGDTDSSISYMKIEAVPAYNTTPGRDKYHPRHRPEHPRAVPAVAEAQQQINGRRRKPVHRGKHLQQRALPLGLARVLADL